MTDIQAGRVFTKRRHAEVDPMNEARPVWPIKILIKYKRRNYYYEIIQYTFD